MQPLSLTGASLPYCIRICSHCWDADNTTCCHSGDKADCVLFLVLLQHCCSWWCSPLTVIAGWLRADSWSSAVSASGVREGEPVCVWGGESESGDMYSAAGEAAPGVSHRPGWPGSQKKQGAFSEKNISFCTDFDSIAILFTRSILTWSHNTLKSHWSIFEYIATNQPSSLFELVEQTHLFPSAILGV